MIIEYYPVPKVRLGLLLSCAPVHLHTHRTMLWGAKCQSSLWHFVHHAWHCPLVLCRVSLVSYCSHVWAEHACSCNHRSSDSEISSCRKRSESSTKKKLASVMIGIPVSRLMHGKDLNCLEAPFFFPYTFVHNWPLRCATLCLPLWTAEICILRFHGCNQVSASLSRSPSEWNKYYQKQTRTGAEIQSSFFCSFRVEEM